MKFHLSRAAIATGLGVSLWLTTVGAFAAVPQQTQDQSKTSTQSQSTQNDQKATTQNPQNTTAQTLPQPTTNKKTLPTNEDPTMIGKRNINKGIWAHGPLGASGTEAEVKLGRQLAAEVDRQAKFVDDPIITEYV